MRRPDEPLAPKRRRAAALLLGVWTARAGERVSGCLAAGFVLGWALGFAFGLLAVCRAER